MFHFCQIMLKTQRDSVRVRATRSRRAVGFVGFVALYFLGRVCVEVVLVAVDVALSPLQPR